MSEDIVYRIQDKDGRGPWKPGFSHRWVKDRADHDNLPPWFVEFGAVHKQTLVGEGCACGCLTVDQLRRWFTKREYKRLRKFGYQAVRIKAGRIIASSDIQCVFGFIKPLTQGAIPFNLY